MTVYNSEYDILYISAPKCASSSLKTVFFELENGFEWRNYKRNGRVVHVHNVYPAISFEAALKEHRKGAWTFAIIRDPISRLVSCYKNRVMTGPWTKMPPRKVEAVKAMGLSMKPDFDEFVDRLEDYRAASDDLRWHCDKMVDFLGHDASFYDALYDISEMSSLYADLQKRCNGVAEIPHLQTRGSDVKVAAIGSDTEQKIRRFYADDYKVFGQKLETLNA